MRADRFIDANVLVCLLSADVAKADVANAVVTGGGVVSVQVLNEFANVARRNAGLDWREIRESLDVLKAVLTIRPLDVATHVRGLAIAERHGYSLYDSMIVAAALESGCAELLSEDMQQGQVIDGLTIRNPFRA